MRRKKTKHPHEAGVTSLSAPDPLKGHAPIGKPYFRCLNFLNAAICAIAAANSACAFA